MALNKVQLIGHLGRDPEIRYAPSGDAVANFSVATTERWKDKNTQEQKEKTEWHRITVWGRLAEVVGQYLKKGSKVYVEGKLQTRQYEKDGVTHYATEVVMQNMEMLDGKPQDGGTSQPLPAAGGQGAGGGGGGQRSTPTPRPVPNFSDMDDDIPF
jgi:single-strand DNA-binding protein